ncbi:MAG: hypothetical protein A2Y98_03445 [Candidatus Portnoybacteria bacterium RBG_19FT_COMBO_36_7]|uniref:GerMN domain-containing protein n=1 Tax=Candidatus Portnoybacteria bacterium RBG_19FT_COMBO_36_7 TaxID=1801992 RepID=A0A1G2F7C9_9BACT|nr:MAG: hypothetical protein A2Y98_03445 [Candidatus Portnoybacteria bacterium RBG_19FT_COMBO_36_7]
MTNMTKKILFAIGIVIAIAIVLLILRSPEDSWICENGQWVKHGNPSASMPTEPCGDQTQQEIFVTSPQQNQTVASPLIVRGRVRGSWFFEASFPIKILDAQGNEISVSYVQAKGEWMTSDFVDFEGQLRFISPSLSSGTLVLQNDNPSGLPENQKEFRVPVIFDAGLTQKVKVFFNNSNLDPEASCNKVFPVQREIPKTDAPARAALEELLAGATYKEQSESYFTSINSGAKIQSLTIENGVAHVDFDEQLEFQVGGSCRVSAIRAQITETLKQFSTVSSVIISINGRTEDILQP